MTIALLADRVRPEEKLLLEAYAARLIPVERIDPRRLSLRADDLSSTPELEQVTVVHDRSIAFGTSMHLTELLETRGLVCVNSSAVVRTCGDKLRTSAALARRGVPQPETRVAFSPEEALRLLDEELGFPAVLKPVVGSWGRLVARLNDRHAAEAVLEDRATLGNWTHGTLYLQRLVRKPERDLRVFLIGDEPVAGIARVSEHWVTNTARGARVENLDLESELGRRCAELALAAGRAVGGGLLAVDLVEDPLRGPLVLEVNHGFEFRNSSLPTGVDLAGCIADYVGRVREAHTHWTEVPA